MLQISWKKLSIRTQLIVLMSLLLIIVELGTLLLVNYFDQQERRNIAIEQAETLGRSMNNDLLRALVSPGADVFSDISFRLSGFTSVDALVLYNENNKPVFSYGDTEHISKEEAMTLLLDQSFFSLEGRLFLKLPVQADNFVFGQVLIVINPERYQTSLREHFLTLLLIFPVLLTAGLIIAWRMSRLFTLPFQALANAIEHNDVDNNKYNKVETQAENEIQTLFCGYNAMIEKIEKTTALMDYRSRHDSLTGLFNRYAIEQEIIHALKTPLKNKYYHALLNIDLDQFKLINDSLGHTAGDELLKMIAHYFQNHCCETTSVGRIGGDDFLLLLKNTQRETAIQFAEQVLEDLKDFRFFWEGNAVTISASIGLVLFKPFEYTLDELINIADITFYSAKSLGRNKLHIYDPQDHDKEQKDNEIAIAGYIKDALQQGPARFELFAQTIVPLQYSDDKISYEVLIRMWGSNNQFLAPDSFLSVAERYHMMVEIDMYVLWHYLETVCKHPEHLKRLHSVHLNLAGGTLNNHEFQEKLKLAIKTFDFPWHCLEMEITETSAVGNLNQATDFINFCRDRGIGFALDDFGTGMASFEYLKHLPFNVVKIDGSFVRDMLSDPFDHTMICYTHDISQLRNQETVAEYVETEEEVNELRKIGITYGQGYFLGKPMPLNDWL